MNNKYNMKAKQIDLNEENVFKLELLRFKAFGDTSKNIGYTIYSIGLLEGNMLPFGFYINGNLVAGCYVSAKDDTLFIEQLFVEPALQNTSLRAGRLLLSYVLLQKEKIEQYFNTRFEYSTLDPSNSKAKALFEKMDYEEVPKIDELIARNALMQKRLK